MIENWLKCFCPDSDCNSAVEKAKLQNYKCSNQTKWKSEQNHSKAFSRAVEIYKITDYGHRMAKSLILCGPNSNPNPK